METLRSLTLTAAVLASLGGTALAVPAAQAVPQQPVASQAQATNDTFSDREWRLRLPGVSPSVYDIGWITIHRNGSVRGSDGCNNIFGSASVDATSGRITFTGVGTTRRACRIATGSRLVITTEAGDQLEFVR